MPTQVNPFALLATDEDDAPPVRQTIKDVPVPQVAVQDSAAVAERLCKWLEPKPGNQVWTCYKSPTGRSKGRVGSSITDYYKHRPDDQTLIKSFGGLKKFAKAHADRFQWIDGDIPSNTKLRAKKHGSNGGGGGSRAPKQTHNPMVKVNHYSSHTSSSSANAESSPSVSPAATDYVDRDRPVEVYLTCGENQAHLFWKNPKNEAWLREVLEPSGKVLKLFLNDENSTRKFIYVRMENADAAERAIGQKHHVPNGKEYIKVDKNRSTKPPPPHVKKRQQMQLQQQQKQQLQATREHDENVMDPTISRHVFKNFMDRDSTISIQSYCLVGETAKVKITIKNTGTLHEFTLGRITIKNHTNFPEGVERSSSAPWFTISKYPSQNQRAGSSHVYNPVLKGPRGSATIELEFVPTHAIKHVGKLAVETTLGTVYCRFELQGASPEEYHDQTLNIESPTPAEEQMAEHEKYYEQELNQQQQQQQHGAAATAVADTGLAALDATGMPGNGGGVIADLNAAMDSTHLHEMNGANMGLFNVAGGATLSSNSVALNTSGGGSGGTSSSPINDLWEQSVSEYTATGAFDPLKSSFAAPHDEKIELGSIGGSSAFGSFSASMPELQSDSWKTLQPYNTGPTDSIALFEYNESHGYPFWNYQTTHEGGFQIKICTFGFNVHHYSEDGTMIIDLNMATGVDNGQLAISPRGATAAKLRLHAAPNLNPPRIYGLDADSVTVHYEKITEQRSAFSPSEQLSAFSSSDQYRNPW
eukprot:gene1290-8171_t